MVRQKMTLKEIQKVELETLIAFHNFCEKYNLQYYLCGGTLIGAVRDQRFIPWDDDIDTMMPRPDYMRLIKIAKDGMIDQYHKICTYDLDEGIPIVPYVIRIVDIRTEIVFHNMRVPYYTGCFIDVFAIDGVPSSKILRKMLFKGKQVLVDLFFCCVTKMGTKRRNGFVTIMQYFLLPFLPIIRLPGYKTYQFLINKCGQKFPFDICDFIAVVPGRGEERETMRREDLWPYKLVEFEGHQFYAMGNYLKYLSNMYNNFMELPPKNDRLPHHYFDAFWINSI